MKALISKSEIKGKVVAPSSKSYTIRGLMCAALANGESEIISPLGSDDTEAAIEVLNKIGVRVLQEKGRWLVSGGNFSKPEADLFCRESATTLRFMTAISALIPGKCRLTSAPSLARRPIEPLLQALRQLGIDCYQDEQAAIVVQGGRLSGGVTELAGNISSQFVSALLLISPFADEGIKIRLTTPLESQPYILMTLEYLEKFGIKVDHSENLREFAAIKQSYKPTKFRVEGDWSSASYLLALGAMGGEIEVENLNAKSLQGDRVILDFLKDMGASVTIGKSSITVARSRLRAIKANLTDCIDLLPTVAVLAASAEGTSQFDGIARARLKESDRVAAVREGLERMGIKVVAEKNRLSVTGSPFVESGERRVNSPATRLPESRRDGGQGGAVIDTRGDHRIAMAFSLLGTVAGETTIEGAECVAKTYPEYWETLKGLGGEVQLNG